MRDTALSYALFNNQIEIFEKLLKSKADPNKLWLGKPLLWSLVNSKAFSDGEKKLNAIQKLLNAGADKNLKYEGTTALQLLENNSDENSLKIKQILIENK